MLHWMLRIVNVEKALLGRGYPQNINGQVHIEVFDEILPWNKGKFIITLEQGNIK
jgi:Predicted acetyltransferase involved in intracellular survival and related acetyltransferases